MSILSPLTTTQLTRERLAELVADQHMHLLRWLIWFPLLSVEEIGRLEQARLAERGKTRSRQMMASQLAQMETLDLVNHVVINEREWPPHHFRYHLTDTGLYVFASAFDPPLSVPRLAQAYAVERADLIERLVRLEVHLTLADFSTRLFAEGYQRGYPLVSYQQPWVQRDFILGHRQTLRLDAAFLLAHPQGTEHSFYVRVDSDECRLFDGKQERLPLLRLLDLRHALLLRHETMPVFLIVTRIARLRDWIELLEKTSTQRGTALLDGAITTLERLQQEGVHGPIWWPFPELVQWNHSSEVRHLPESSVVLSALLGPPAGREIMERFSQRRTFAHLLTARMNSPFRKTARPFPSYVGTSLSQQATRLRAEVVADGLHGTKAEQKEVTALLTLALSPSQKQILSWLTHHQFLTMHQLATLLHPGRPDIRGIQQQLTGLLRLNLLLPFIWYGNRPWYERERYLLSDSALRYMALREGKPATAYLLPEKYKKSKGPLSLQPGSSGLFAQMEHTHELYECMCRILEVAHRERIHVILWRNAREAIRSYHDPFTSAIMQVRPDAEILYLFPGEEIPRSVLVEYDRATLTRQQYESKMLVYVDYQHFMHVQLPLLLIVTQNVHAATLIQASIQSVAKTLQVVIMLADELEQQGLLALLNEPS